MMAILTLNYLSSIDYYYDIQSALIVPYSQKIFQ